MIALDNRRCHLVNPFDKFIAAAARGRPFATAFRSTARLTLVRLHFGVASRSGGVFQSRRAALGLARYRRSDKLVFTGNLFRERRAMFVTPPSGGMNLLIMTAA